MAESPPAHAIYDRIAALGFSPTITSVDHGGHVKGSDHYAHRALDIGAVNGATVGVNAATWDFLTKAIASGVGTHFGTFKAFAQDAGLQAWAKQHGVTLFEDEGSGPHIHIADHRAPPLAG